MLTFGGSKVSIKGNFKGKGKCAIRVVSQDSVGFVNFSYFLPVARGRTPCPPTCKAAQCTNLVRYKNNLYNTHIQQKKQKKNQPKTRVVFSD